MDNHAVECHDLSRRFGSQSAVAGLDFTMPRGSVFGFLGPNGAGKTTTVRLMLGLLRPTSGSVRVLGQDPLTDGEKVRRQCGVMLDNVGLYDRMTALQNLELAARIARLDASERRVRVEAGLHRVDLWERRGDRVSGFSKGMRQKLGLARALMADPQMLILDEPTAGLDPTSIVMVRELLVSLAQESGRSIFLCTHLLAEAQRICDRVGIIQNGRLLALGAPNHLGNVGLSTIRLTLSGGDRTKMEALPLPRGATLEAITGSEWRVSIADEADIEPIVAALVADGIGVRAVVPEQVSLEEEYLRLVGGGNDD